MQPFIRFFSLLSIFLSFNFSLISQVEPKGNLNGIISNGHEGLPGAYIKIDETNKGTVSDIDGSFKLIGLKVGNHQLKISYLGYKSLVKNITIQANQTVNLNKIILETSISALKEVVVQGNLKGGSETKAMNMMRVSPRMVTVVAAETIKKLPDRNAAETVKRLQGASVQNSKGEGAYVSLRGTPVDWTSTLVNGHRLPVADEENTSRTFEFEVLPSDLIDFVVLTRSVTPDIEADNIGGAINFLTKSAVDTFTLSATGAGGYNYLANKPMSQANLLIGNRSKNGKFSYVVNGSYYQRGYAAQGYKLGYKSNVYHSIYRLDVKDYEGNRNTLGFNVAAEYKATKWYTFQIKGLYGSMKEDKWQNKSRFDWADGDGRRSRIQKLHGLLDRELAGGEFNNFITFNQKVKLDIRLASYANQFTYGNSPFDHSDPRNGYTAIEFVSPNINTLKDLVTVDDANGGKPGPNTQFTAGAKLLDVDNPYGTGDNYKFIHPQPYHDDDSVNPWNLKPKDYSFYQVYSEINRTFEKDPIIAQMDLHYDVNNNLKLQFGTKFRNKQGSRYISKHTWQVNSSKDKLYYDSLNTQPFNYKRGGFMAEYGTGYNNYFQPSITKDQFNSFLTTYKDYSYDFYMDKHNSENPYWVGSSYTYKENQYAGYGMFDWNLLKNRLQLVGGVRVEYTTLKEYSDTVDINNLETDTFVLGGQKLVSVHPPVVGRTTDRKYFAFLPSLNANYDLSPNNKLRAAISRTFHRPNFEETKPGAAVFRLDDNQLNFGNPKLKPTYSYNVDASFEHFWGNLGMFSIGGYYKYVVDHIFAVTTQEKVLDASGFAFKRYQNAANSWVGGVELAYIKMFDKLPKFLGGFGVNLNVTVSTSRMSVPGRTFNQPMTEQSPLLTNFTLIYDKYGYDIRLAFNYTAAYTKDLNLASGPRPDGTVGLYHDNQDFDIFYGRSYSLDLSASKNITKRIQVYIQLMNLLDAPYKLYIGRPDRPLQTEFYRQRGLAGLKFNLN